MANIREVLEIQDRFSSSFQTFVNLGERVASTLDHIDKTLDENVVHQDRAARAAQNHGETAKRATASIDGLAGSVGRLIAALGGVAAVRGFVAISDTLTQTEARLNAVNDGLQTTEELQRMIYSSAQSARGSWTDMSATVASLGAQTRGVFDSTAEIVRFTELLNKQFAISGTSLSGISSTMYNLTQALSTGVLRGNDLQMVLSNAPALVQKIGDYMGKNVGEIRALAQEGKITADIVKNAIMGAGDEIDRSFEQMPMTFGQAVQKLKNRGILALQPLAQAFTRVVNSERFERVMDSLANGIAFVADAGEMAFNALGAAAIYAQDNLGSLLPVLGILAGAYIALQVAGVSSGLATAAAWAVAHWPLILIGALLGGLIVNIIQTSATAEEAGQRIGRMFGFVYAVGHNALAMLWNQTASFAEFFANVWNDPLGAMARLFFQTLNNILGMVEAVANAIDALTGSNLSGAVSGFRDKLKSWTTEKFGDNAIQIQRMANIDTAAAMEEFSLKGGQLGQKIDGLGKRLEDVKADWGGFDFGGAGAGGTVPDVGTVGRVKSVDNVKLDDEDIKVYRDLAERRYMANVELQTLAPNISVSIPESAAKNLTSEDVAEKIKTILIEQSAAHTAVAHAH